MKNEKAEKQDVPILAIEMAVAALQVEINYGTSSQTWKADATGYVDQINSYLKRFEDGAS